MSSSHARSGAVDGGLAEVSHHGGQGLVRFLAENSRSAQSAVSLPVSIDISKVSYRQPLVSVSVRTVASPSLGSLRI